MKKQILVCFCTIILIAACLSGCGDPGTPPVLTVDGKDITLGDSTPTNLPEGFECTFAGNYLPIGSMPGNSWMSDLLSAKKDNETYAYLYLYNPTKNEVTYLRATIYKISFRMNSEDASYWAVNNILVNGINFYGMNIDEVKAAMQEYKAPSESSYGDRTSLIYEDGNYYYTIRFGENGLVDEVQVEMTIPKN
ncbi:MAG: hypothetical protein K2I01_02130 [Lachnospiraceae bacterium]|nr:hypothetical protein [Lachnospiraceae bacterium]MDE6128070.1 hypothetical protein [Lachnospiraceae bacterium]